MRTTRRWTMREVGGLAFLLCLVAPTWAAEMPPSYPAMSPIEQYRMVSASEEVALARSAAPTSISGDAEVLTLGNHGYETAVKGKNGFVCLVWRSWAAGFDDPNFWNPTLRSPICLNPAAARSILPGYFDRTGWAIAGVSKSQMIERTRTQLAAHSYIAPAPGAMSFMMSKQGYLGDGVGHWHPHLMFFVAHTDDAAWGANLDGSPVFASQSSPELVTTFYVPVPQWSDGTPAVMETH